MCSRQTRNRLCESSAETPPTTSQGARRTRRTQSSVQQQRIVRHRFRCFGSRERLESACHWPGVVPQLGSSGGHWTDVSSSTSLDSATGKTGKAPDPVWVSGSEYLGLLTFSKSFISLPPGEMHQQPVGHPRRGGGSRAPQLDLVQPPPSSEPMRADRAVESSTATDQIPKQIRRLSNIRCWHVAPANHAIDTVRRSIPGVRGAVRRPAADRARTLHARARTVSLSRAHAPSNPASRHDRHGR